MLPKPLLYDDHDKRQLKTGLTGLRCWNMIQFAIDETVTVGRDDTDKLVAIYCGSLSEIKMINFLHKSAVRAVWYLLNRKN
jgi:hypothetical protein